MIHIRQYIENAGSTFLKDPDLQPWEILGNLEDRLTSYIQTLGEDYRIEKNVAIHKTATIEQGVTFKGTIVIAENCFIGAHAYLRGPIYLANSVTIGPGCEIKHSVLYDHTAVAHFNYVGNSILGKHVNMEAGSICANHYNERENKRIFVTHNGQLLDTQTEKFGSLIGDHSKIGANAVLSPGTILEKRSIVKRLELVEQTGTEIE